MLYMKGKFVTELIPTLQAAPKLFFSSNHCLKYFRKTFWKTALGCLFSIILLFFSCRGSLETKTAQIHGKVQMKDCHSQK